MKIVSRIEKDYKLVQRTGRRAGRMKREHFITKKVMYRILARYGGRRKYILSERYTDKKYQIVFTEKGNLYKWLCMTSRDGGVLVTLTGETGKIVQRDFYTEAGEPDAAQKMKL